MKVIDPSDLVDIGALAAETGANLRTDLIYANAAHPLNQTFKTAIYRPDAKMWMHKELARIVLLAADRAGDLRFRLLLTDCLRTTDAQQRMVDTEIVRKHPHWTADGPGRLISLPGTGAHPRGMAVDVTLEGLDGESVFMGTPLDWFTKNPDDNPAARNYRHISHAAKTNRRTLQQLMTFAADHCGLPLLPLPSEWWDFRFPPSVYEQYAPLSDADLPPEMRMCT